MSDIELSKVQGERPQALRVDENEGLLSAIVNQSTVGVAVVGLEGRFKFMNECFSRLVGRSREELLRLSFADITHSDDLPGNAEMFERARNGHGNFEIEKRYVRPDGTQVWVHNNVTFLRDGAGVPYAVMAVTLDISDRKRAEARQARLARHTALRAEVSAAFNEGGPLRAILQSCAGSMVRHLDAALARIWTLDDGGAVLELQASSGLYVHLDGRHARVPVGRYKIGLIAIERKPHLTNNVQEDERVGNKEWARREGLVSFAGYPLVAEGRLVGVVAMFSREALGQDTIEAIESIAAIVTQGVERKQAEEALRETQRELAHLNRVMTVGELTSSIAHEINQPLAAIVMNGNAALRWLALDPPDVARARSSAESIIRDGDRASQVISRIRALLKKTPSAKSALDVGELVREVIALTRHEVTRNKVILRTDLADDLPHVSGDRIQLQQVMINLTVNAVDAMRGVKGGRREMLIAAVKESGGVRVTVSDTGGGFDPGEAERLFDAFYTTKPEGMGMGLAISRSIIEAHGGRLWAEPNERGGAGFHFTLPVGEGVSP